MIFEKACINISLHSSDSAVSVCVIQFNVTFNSISVISWRCLLVADIVLPHLKAISQVYWYSILPGHILQSTTGTDHLSLIYPLNAERLARRHQVQFLRSLVWPGQELNPQPPTHQASALSLDHWVQVLSFVEVCIQQHMLISKKRKQGDPMSGS